MSICTATPQKEKQDTLFLIKDGLDLLDKKISYLNRRIESCEEHKNHNIIPRAFIDAQFKVPTFKSSVCHNKDFSFVEITLYFSQIAWGFTELFYIDTKIQSNEEICAKMKETKENIIERLFLNSYTHSSPLSTFINTELLRVKTNHYNPKNYISNLKKIMDIYHTINRGSSMLKMYGTPINMSFLEIDIFENGEDIKKLDKEIREKCRLSLRDWFR
jgi:hypothetical protein